MPIEVKAYKCSHGCTRRILQDRSAMVRHEKTCFLNPETKSCRTCANDHHHFYTKEDGHSVVCKLIGETPPLSNCPQWEIKHYLMEESA